MVIKQSIIEIKQPLGRVAHVYDSAVSSTGNGETIIDTRNFMNTCTTLILKAFGSGHVQVTLDGIDPTSGVHNVLRVNGGQTIKLEGIAIRSEIKARGSAASQGLSVLCWGE